MIATKVTYGARKVDTATNQALRRFKWAEFVNDFDNLKDSEMLVFSAEAFGITSFALAGHLKRALDQRKHYDEAPTPATVRRMKDGTVIVAKSRSVEVRRSPYS